MINIGFGMQIWKLPIGFDLCLVTTKKNNSYETWQVARNWSSFDLLTVQLIKAPYAKIYNIIKTQTMSEGSVDEVTEEHSRTTLQKPPHDIIICVYVDFFSPTHLLFDCISVSKWISVLVMIEGHSAVDSRNTTKL